MYSVSIKHRVITLASKRNSGYQLPYLDASADVHQCDPVYFTGLDGLQNTDEFVGYISEVENNPMSRYMIVNVSNNSKCSGS
jgi:cell shape-determining protein MreC